MCVNPGNGPREISPGSILLETLKKKGAPSFFLSFPWHLVHIPPIWCIVKELIVVLDCTYIISYFFFFLNRFLLHQEHSSILSSLVLAKKPAISPKLQGSRIQVAIGRHHASGWKPGTGSAELSGDGSTCAIDQEYGLSSYRLPWASRPVRNAGLAPSRSTYPIVQSSMAIGLLGNGQGSNHHVY